MFSLSHSFLAASLSVALFLGVQKKACAHGSQHEQITAISEALKTKPDDAELLLMRAGLHREDQAWDAATADISFAEKAGANAGLLALSRTELAVARADWESAAKELPTVARELPGHCGAWRLAALVQTTRGQRAEAAAAWRVVIEKSETPRPDDFLSLARVLHSVGSDDDAIAALDAGARRLGEVSVFIEEAAQIEEARGRWDAALARCERLIALSPNSPRPLARKGDLADRAGRADVASSARHAALSAIENLPPARRNTPAISALEKTLREQLALK